MAERLDRPGNWQCPQGGVDDIIVNDDDGSGGSKTKETIVDAAIRELYEETGLLVGQHVLLDPTFPIPSVDGGTGVRYSTSSSTGNNWLTQAGFAGQELHWTVFRCMNGRGDLDPSDMCDLSGQDGSTAEFSRVAWMDINTAVQGVWEGKRAPYRLLESLIETHGDQWAAQITLLDFSGTWERDLLQSTNVVSALEARGMDPDESFNEAQKPYIQCWEKHPDDSSSWFVTTFEADGKTPRRKLEYKPGSWTETYEGKATLFGESLKPVTLNRQTKFVAEADGAPVPIAQVTITYGPKGIEESRRYLKDGKFILRRTFWSTTAPTVPAVSTEVFIKRS
jgi:putative (di)nucleoside polyphosphate hydrolase